VLIVEVITLVREKTL